MQQSVTIYSKDYCPYCDRAKEFFDSRGMAYKEIDVSRDEKAYAELRNKTHHMTVPQIFIGEKFVGGYTDLIAKVKSGEISL